MVGLYSRNGLVNKPMIDNGLSDDPIQAVKDILNSPEFQLDNSFDLPPISSGSSSLSGQAALMNAALAADKFNYPLKQDNAAQAQALAKKNALMNMYKSGGFYPTQDLLGSIEDMRTSASGGINEQLLASLTGIGEGYGAAEDLTTTGYSDLRNYLSQEQANPYQNVELSGGNVSNDLQSLLESQGAASPEVSQYAQLLNASQQSGTSQFQNLLSTLAALETSGRSSRQREAEMAGTVAGTSLGQQRASYEGQLRSQANQALVQLANDIAQKQFEVKQNEAAQKASLAQTLAEAGIDVFSGTFGEGEDPTGFEPTLIDVPDSVPVVTSPGGPTGGGPTGGGADGQPVVSPTGIAGSNTAPVGYRYDKSGKLVPNLGNEAPGFDKPTATELAQKPTVPAGKDLHWEWNGNKWVPTPNKGAVAPTATPTPAQAPAPTPAPVTPAKAAAIAQAPAPPGFRYDAAGTLVANAGKDAPGYKPPTTTQLSAKPSTPAGDGLHWEWNGSKWVPVPNKGVTAPVAAPAAAAAAPAPSLPQILAQPAPAAVPSFEEIMAELAKIDFSNLDLSGIGSFF